MLNSTKAYGAMLHWRSLKLSLVKFGANDFAITKQIYDFCFRAPDGLTVVSASIFGGLWTTKH
ncbi:hypothetical protein PRUPE_6G338900 [Prunus persica]|uniref:Uncharacterized protein n=1 Tax=Prunus persica TaxID=3760 RepID=A0A251NZL2_PRUPE|nr:hypothetical protein PRUPE_6G338900 [Prunus persica]